MGFLAWVIGIGLVVLLITIVINVTGRDEQRVETMPALDGNSDEADGSDDSDDGDEETDEDTGEPIEEEDQRVEEHTAATTEPATGEEAVYETDQQAISQSVPEPSGTTAGDTDDTVSDSTDVTSQLDLEDAPSGDESTEDLSLPFEPINTFEPDPDQWTTLHRDTHSYSWPEADPEVSAEYEDRTNPEAPSEAIEQAIDWLNTASTEAIHQQQKREYLLDCLKKFIENPRAHGAELISQLEWRENNANISRLIGDRFLMLALGMSCHGPVEMSQHLEALGSFLNDTWNEDGLEHPIVYQGIGRLGLFTPTSLEDVQPTLTNRVEGQIPRSSDTGPIDEASLHGLLMAVAAGPEYPFGNTEDNLPKAWHWDGNNPPLASWDQLLPFLYTLWLYHWNQDDTGGAVRDLGPMLGSWWNDNPPPDNYFNEHPEVWEGVLMFAWATTPRLNHVWEQLWDRYDELSIEDENLQTLTQTYFDWAQNIQEDGSPPGESFVGQRMPPIDWIQPLPSDIIQDFSQPSYDFPESWSQQLGSEESPDTSEL